MHHAYYNSCALYSQWIAIDAHIDQLIVERSRIVHDRLRHNLNLAHSGYLLNVTFNRFIRSALFRHELATQMAPVRVCVCVCSFSV